MKFVLVGDRDGSAVVNWPGVLAAAAIVAGFSVAVAAAFMLALGWFSPGTLVLVAALNVCCVVGLSISRLLQLPIDQLTPLK